MAILELSTAFNEKRTALKQVKRQRKSLATIIGAALAVLSVRLSYHILPVLGLSSLTAAAWGYDWRIGLITLGIGFFVLDYGRGS